QEGQAGSIFRTEEDIHVGKDLLDAFTGFVSGPEIAAEIDVKGDQSSLFLEALDHFDSGFPCVRTECQGDAAGVETAGGGEHFFIIIADMDLLERGMCAVVD